MSAAAPYRKSGFFNNKIMNPLLTALGLAPALTVRGRTSGRRYTMPVLPLDYEGKRYLVAPRGNTHWARNLRAVGQCGLRVGGRKGRFIAREIPWRSGARWSPHMFRNTGRSTEDSSPRNSPPCRIRPTIPSSWSNRNRRNGKPYEVLIT